MTNQVMDDPLFFTLRSLMSHTKKLIPKYRPSEAKVYKICEATKKIMRKAVISILTGTQSPDSLLGGGIEILKGEGLPCLIFSFLLTTEAFAVLRSDAATHVC
ncbi:Meiotic recombination protein dmc1 [Orobanche minor]